MRGVDEDLGRGHYTDTAFAPSIRSKHTLSIHAPIASGFRSRKNWHLYSLGLLPVTTSPPVPPTHGSDSEAKARAIVRQLRMIIRVMQGHSNTVERACGISAAQLWALWEIQRSPGLKVSDLARQLSIHPSTASNLLDKLEESGLIERQRRERDQRVVRLFATSAGSELLESAPAPPQGELNHALQALNPEQICQLHDGLEQLISNLSTVEPNSALQPLTTETR